VAKTTYVQTNFTAGEVSPRALGRFDLAKYTNAVKTLENFLIYQLGGALYRPGTRFVAEVKDQTARTRLIPFQFSTTQNYIVEIGDAYMRFYTLQGQLISGGFPVEIVTPYALSEIFDLHISQNADTMYITHPLHKPAKLQRTSATTFTLTDVSFVRGPFLDTNITATTITPSSATGATTLTASVAIFNAIHVGSLWRVKTGVVLITGFTSTTIVNGTVQAEPDGVAGNLGGVGATADWAEGAFSDFRGWPSTNTFHEQRLYYANTADDPQDFWGSTIEAYDNFKADASDDEAAVHFQIVSDQVNAIRWLSSGSGKLEIGTSGGTFTATSGTQGFPITATNINVERNTTYGAAKLQPKRISSYLYYLQRNLFYLRELNYDFLHDTQISEDMTLLADHILRDGEGVVDMDYQQSPNDRMWVVRDDGTMAVLTRNAGQEVIGWSRVISGSTSQGAGTFESVAVIPQDLGDDEIWVVVRRLVDGVEKRYVEFFTEEQFNNYWEPVRLDSSLTYDSPLVITGATQADPVVITSVAHGLSNGNEVRIDLVEGMTELNGNFYKVANVAADTFEITDNSNNDIDGTLFEEYITGGEARELVTVLSGLDHLEGEEVTVQTDGAIPSATQTYPVVGGSITLAISAATIHVGLPYVGLIQMLKQSDGSLTTGQTKNRRIYLSTIRLFKSLGFEVGIDEDNLLEVPIGFVNGALGHAPDLVSGDIEKIPTAYWTKEGEFVIKQDRPVPLFILAVVLRSELEEKV
jgi:hypothetical protein